MWMTAVRWSLAPQTLLSGATKKNLGSSLNCNCALPSPTELISCSWSTRHSEMRDQRPEVANPLKVEATLIARPVFATCNHDPKLGVSTGLLSQPNIVPLDRPGLLFFRKNDLRQPRLRDAFSRQRVRFKAANRYCSIPQPSHDSVA